jgi:hypothetical protein
VSNRLHEQGKLVMGNLGTEAYRLYAHLIDVLGCESERDRAITAIESDAGCSLRRTFAYRKPAVTLLQKGNYSKPVPAVTREEMEQYIKHQMFYGFYPGVSTIGGEEKPGYANWKRYFGSAEQFDRDRDLFKKYIPIIRRINEAGWEPITYARVAGEEDGSVIFIERFGDWGKGNLHFNVRNTTKEGRKALVTVELGKMGAAQQDLDGLVATEIVSGRKLPVKADPDARLAQLELDLVPFDTIVVSMDK